MERDEVDGYGDGGDVLDVGTSVSRHRVRTSIVGGLVAASLATWMVVGDEGQRSTPDAHAPEPARDALPEPRADSDVADAFYSYATTGDATVVSSLWADFVTLSAPGTTRTMTSEEASSRDAWWSAAGAHGRRARDLLQPLEESRGAFTLYAQDMACVGHGRARPADGAGRVTSRVTVAIRPSAGTPCTRWWAVDLVLGRDRRISQVSIHR